LATLATVVIVVTSTLALKTLLTNFGHLLANFAAFFNILAAFFNLLAFFCLTFCLSF